MAVVHLTPALAPPDTNREALVEAAREAASAARVVVLPELATTGFRLSPEQAAAWAEGLLGATPRALAAVARERRAVLVVGLLLREADGALSNAQLVLDGDARDPGPLGVSAAVYRKHHLFGEDLGWARPGPRPGAVVETSAGRVGLLICHDIVYPRTVLAVARGRPRLVAFSTAWIGSGESLPEPWLLATRLLDPAPLCAANRGGAEGEVRFDDPSAILSHSSGGVVGRRGPGPQVLVADL